MHEYILIEIGQKLRKIRKDKGLTVQTIAARAGVSKGLISRIENSRTIPSLPVLISIVKGLDVDLNTFFSDIDQSVVEQILVKKAADLESEDDETPNIKRLAIFDKNLPESTVKTSIIELKSVGKQSFQSTKGLSYHYILRGKIHYEIGEVTHDLSTGDSLYFDTRLMHSFWNTSTENARVLVMDFKTI